MLKKEDLDDAFKDKKFPENSKVELLFERDTDRLHGVLLTGFFVGAGLGKKTCMYTYPPRIIAINFYKHIYVLLGHWQVFWPLAISYDNLMNA